MVSGRFALAKNHTILLCLYGPGRARYAGNPDFESEPMRGVAVFEHKITAAAGVFAIILAVGLFVSHL